MERERFELVTKRDTRIYYTKLFEYALSGEMFFISEEDYPKTVKAIYGDGKDNQGRFLIEGEEFPL